MSFGQTDQSAPVRPRGFGVRIMRQGLILFTLAFGLGGCAERTAYMEARGSSLTATNRLWVSPSHDSAILVVGDRTYSGRWIERGDLVDASHSPEWSLALPTAAGATAGLPVSAEFHGFSPDGAWLKCTWRRTFKGVEGLGLCHDSRGRTYDLQIF
jgi:hypothetical protein